MIIKEAIGVGSSVEAAREDAVNKLGAAFDEDVKFDIICIQKKKVLGIFGGSDAKVRAYVEGPDEAPKKSETQSRNKSNRNNNRNNERKNGQKAEKTVKAEVKAEPKAKAPVLEFKPGVLAEQVDPASQAGKAYIYLKKVLEKLDCNDISATICEIEGGSKITLEGNDKLGVIIGRRGETLDALQYLASLVANEKGSGYYRVVIDIGNYREKRESTLEALAKRTAGQVLRTGRNRSLEPMNPYERRIIHTAIQNIEGVTSISIGEGSGRRVVISPEGKTPRLSSSRGQRGSKQGANHSAAQPKAAVETAQKPKETDGTKMYGKLG